MKKMSKIKPVKGAPKTDMKNVKTTGIKIRGTGAATKGTMARGPMAQYMSMTYSELTANIQDICETTFTSDQIALFTKQAEQNIYNTVQLPSLRKNVTGTVTTGNKYLAVPSDFLYTYSLAVVNSDGSFDFLLNKDVNFIREAYPTPTSTGTPKHYANFNDETFILGPIDRDWETVRV